ncbi:MAG: hypothetical protein MJA83_04695, partial [Gammaproteobacteria bacterium]|nr:hypothetical protein [Gammaproteobacteria bacterium]
QNRPTVFLSGANVHINDGSSMTSSTSGLGNLIVGYDEDNADSQFPYSTKTGTHNLIVGAGHSYTGTGGVVFGFENAIDGLYSTVVGGRHNVARADQSSVSGGYFNEVNAYAATIGGGYEESVGIYLDDKNPEYDWHAAHNRFPDGSNGPN